MLPELTRMEWIRVKVVREKGPKVLERPLDSPAVAAGFIRSLQRKAAHLDREHFWRVDLDSRHKALSVETVSVGTATSSLVHPREVFKGALLMGAVGIIVAHNHPSGETEPSTEDLRTTERLVKAGELLGVSVLDHLILGLRNRVLSLRSVKPDMFKAYATPY